ncbi:MAG: hypothetical protein ACI8QZ_000834 [Chlamydiales bacterium]|jgi:hypothetical protein
MTMWNEMDPLSGSVGEPDPVLYGAHAAADEFSRVLEPAPGEDAPAPMGLAELRRALRELREIHRAEQALLLSQAAEFRLAALQRSADRFPLFGPMPGARCESSWALGLCDERGFARADRVPFAPMLEDLYRRGLGDPGIDAAGRLDGASTPGSGPLGHAVRLASAAVAMEPWPESRLTLARALTAYGADAAAERELEALEATPGIDWSSPAARVLRTAIIGHEAACAAWRGDPEGALEGFLDQLERNPGFHAAAMTVALALTVGDRDAFEHGTRVVGILHRGSRGDVHPEWGQVAACLRSHARTEGFELGMPAGARADLLRQTDPWSVQIAAVLFEGR